MYKVLILFPVFLKKVIYYNIDELQFTVKHFSNVPNIPFALLRTTKSFMNNQL